MKIEQVEDCECDHLDIKEKHPNGCTLNQIIKCHGDLPFEEILKHIKLNTEK
ncbi:MAG: hypothetical protein ACFFAT_06840 [Promethearchaeota archaeon]